MTSIEERIRDALLHIRLLRFAAGGSEALVEGSPKTGQWTILDETGCPILTVEGMSLQ